MEKYLDKNLHGRGYFRKTKQWGLACGIALAGAIVFGSQSASADEVTAQPSVKEAESAVVANKVDDNSVAKQTTAETNSKAQTVVENKDVKSTTSEEKAATNQEGLNKKYESIKELAKKESVVTKETEKVNYETIDLANKDLAKQEQAIKDAAKQNKELNSQLKKAIDEAKKSNINVTLDKTVTHETVDAAKKDIDEQVAQIEKLVSLVSDAKARISKSLEEASKVGVKFEGETELVLTPGKETEFEASVSGAEKTLADLKNKQVTLTNLLNSLSEKAKAGGVEVTKGKTVVLDEKEASELAKKTTEKVELAISDTKFNKDTYEKALAEWNKAVADAKAKVEADYNKALDEFNKKVAEAKAKNEQIKAENEKLAKDSSNAKSQLTKDSTATKNQDGSYNQILKAVAKAKSVTDTKVSHVPLDTIAVLDYSSSYQSKREEALNQLKALIQNDLTDQDNVMLQAYIYNKENSFVAHGAQLDFSKLSEKDWETGVSTLLLSKKEALEVIDRLLAIKAPNTPGGAANYSDYFNAVAKAFGDKAFKTNETATGGTVKTVPFEEVYTSQPNKNKIVSVIQFTDGWADTEKMDSTFATWAKANAKTFMSVVNRNKRSETDNNDPNSVKSMTELGHPNIYDTTGKSADVVQKEIITQFKNTATEVSSTTTITNSEAVVTITPEEGVKLISAELTSPSGKKQSLEVKDNKVSFKGILVEDGEYKVLYLFNSTTNTKTSIASSFVVSGKEESTTSQDKTVQAPMDLIAMVDASPSYSEHSSSIFPLLKEMMKDANPKSRMAFFATGVNEGNSHVIKKGEATKWLSMSDANKFIDLVIDKMNKREREGWSDKYSSNWFFDVIKEHSEFAIDESYDNKEIEIAHKDLSNKNKIFNVIQVTDGWSQNEGMDTSFAEYVKNNAKTFVSVIQASGKNDFTTNKMKALGLPNTMNLSPIKDVDKIVAKFKETATETILVRGEDKEFVNSDKKLDKFVPIELKNPKDLVEIPNNAPKKGEVKAPEKPKAPKTLSVEIPEVQLKAKGVKIGKVETRVHEVGVETKIHPVSYTEPKVATKEGKVLPHTGETLSASLLIAGLGAAGLASLVLSKKKQEN